MEKRTFFNDVAGMTLVEIMVGLGILSILTLGTMTLFNSLNQVNVRSKASYDKMEMSTLVNDILYSPNACKVTLNDPAGSPLTFNKTNIDEPNSGEGINLTDLYFVAGDGVSRGEVALSTTDAIKKNMGQLEIQSMKLVMDNGTGSNYTTSVTSDRGHLLVKYKIKGMPSGAGERTESYPLWLKFNTDASGLSTVETCSKTYAGLEGGGGGGGSGPLDVPIFAVDAMLSKLADNQIKIVGGYNMSYISVEPTSTAYSFTMGETTGIYNSQNDYLFIAQGGALKTSTGTTLCQFDANRNSCRVTTINSKKMKLQHYNGSISPNDGYCNDTATFHLTPEAVEVDYTITERACVAIGNGQFQCSPGCTNTNRSTKLYFIAN